MLLVKKPIKIQDVPVGSLAVSVEGMENEVRQVTYLRTDGPVKYPNNVSVRRLDISQGVSGESPRYSRSMPSDFTGTSEMDGRIPVHLFLQNTRES